LIEKSHSTPLVPINRENLMNSLSQVLIFKIAATVSFWCIPLVLFPAAWLDAIGFPTPKPMMFLRMLGWAYLALCVGYSFALSAALNQQRLVGAIWAGIVSNGGACGFLLFNGLDGTWANWGLLAQGLMWASTAATAAITIGLYWFGVRDSALTVASGISPTRTS